MRVLFIHPAHPNQFTDIAHTMARVPGVETAFLTDSAWGDQLRSENVPIPYFGYTRDGAPGNPAWYAGSYDEGIRHGKGVSDVFPAVMSAFPADVVIGHGSFGTTFFLKNMYRVPVISYMELPGYHMAWCRPEFPPFAEHLFMNSAFESLVFSTAVNSDRVIVPSAHAANLLPVELRHKVRVRMEGFRLPNLYPDKLALRRKYGLPETGPVIGFASRTLEAMRGFDIFLNAAAHLKQRFPELTVLVLGSEQTMYGNELTYLNGKSFKQFAMEQLNIEPGFFISRDYLAYDAFHEHLQAMDLILFPLFEGAANWGLFEAMASGVPVIASNRCFIPEIIEHGKDGFLFDPYDTTGIVAQSLSILDFPKAFAHIGRSAREKIEKFYSVEAAVAGYLSVINEIL
jgi:glycosyltransferase involved in cell wall biosynthesis